LRGASITDAVLVKSLACATWALWGLLAICFVAEGRAWMRGREARNVPLASLVQPIVRELVVSAALLVGSLRPGGSIAAIAIPVPAAAVTVPDTVPAGPVPADVAYERAAASTNPTCVVAPRDSLWKLAENHLGDGLRWRDIWQLNQGRTFPDGRRFVDPQLINPGWVLSMPADAIGLDAKPPAASPAPQPPETPTRTQPPPTVAATVPSTTPPVVVAAPITTAEPPKRGADAPARGQASPADDPDYE
jgi:hypothetical protein